jgi:hypothetical protein
MRIADTELRMRSDVALLRQPNRAYDSFRVPELGTASTQAQSAIDIEISQERCLPNDSPLLFDAGSPYSAQREEGGYRLSFCREGQRQPHTVLCSDESTTAVKTQT